MSGVTIQNPTLYGIDLTGNVGKTAVEPAVEPLWLDVPNNLFDPTPAKP